MRDRYGRKITYLRMSVIAECNLHCRYCPAPTRRLPLPAAEMLLETAQAAARLGITKIRLTGGEPLLRPDIVWLVSRISAIQNIHEVCLTTNGTLLAHLAQPLAQAGLSRVNVSLDAVSPERYRDICGGEVNPVLRGIEAAIAAGLTPVKLNCVIEHSPAEPGAREVAAFARSRGLTVRYIRRMSPRAGVFYPVINGAGGRCHICNRVRFDVRGYIRPCLFSDLAFSVRELGPEAALRAAVNSKPASGSACSEPGLRLVGG